MIVLALDQMGVCGLGCHFGHFIVLPQLILGQICKVTGCPIWESSCHRGAPLSGVDGVQVSSE